MEYKTGSSWELMNTDPARKQKEEGEYKYYYETGQLLKIEYYSNGEKTGEWKYYKKNGELKRTKTY